ELNWFTAQFEVSDPSRARVHSAARQQAELEQALERDPSLARARLELWELLVQRGEASEVIAALDAIAAMEEGADERTGTEALEFELLRIAAYRSQSNELMADAALARAATLAPRDCSVLTLQRAIAQDRGWVSAADEALAAMDHCSGALGLRGAHAHARGQFDAAQA